MRWLSIFVLLGSAFAQTFDCGGEPSGQSWNNTNSLTCTNCIVTGNALWYNLLPLGGQGTQVSAGDQIVQGVQVR